MPLSSPDSNGSSPNARRTTGRVIPASRSTDLLARSEQLTRDENTLQRVRRRHLHDIAHLRTEAQRRGYEEGLALAVEKTVRTLNDAQRVYRDSEQNLVDLVLTALERIIGDLQAEVVTPKIVLGALRELREDSGHIAIAVHPEMVDIVGEQLAAWRDESASSLELKIIGDDSLGLLDGRLDCGDSVIEAGLQVHLRGVRRALQEIVERADGHDA